MALYCYLVIPWVHWSFPTGSATKGLPMSIFFLKKTPVFITWEKRHHFATLFWLPGDRLFPNITGGQNWTYDQHWYSHPTKPRVEFVHYGSVLPASLCPSTLFETLIIWFCETLCLKQQVNTRIPMCPADGSTPYQMEHRSRLKYLVHTLPLPW